MTADQPLLPNRDAPASTRDAVLCILGLLTAFLIAWIPSLVPVYWYDEIYTVAISSLSSADIIHITAEDVHPPMFYLIVHVLMRIGLLAGGKFTTLAWLRWASLAPGIAICVLGWWIAKKSWGNRPGVLVLWLFALSPGIAYYSVELRNYALSNALMMAATICLLLVAREPKQSSWLVVLAYAFFATLSLYTQNLAILYLAAHGLLVILELVFFSREKTAFLRKALAAFGLTLLFFSPWLSVPTAQLHTLSAKDLPWLTRAEWKDLVSTFFFYFPFGPIDQRSPWKGIAFLVLLTTMTAFLAVAAWVVWKSMNDRKQVKAAASSPTIDRLIGYSLAMTSAPLSLAFVASKMNWAPVFLTFRYNFLALPYWLICIAWLFLKIEPVRLRQLAVMVLLLGSAVVTIRSQRNRTIYRNDLICTDLAPESERIPMDTTIYCINERVMPWLARSGRFQLGWPRDAMSQAASATEPTWFFSHQVISLGPLADRFAVLIERLLSEEPGAVSKDFTPICWKWGQLWKVSPEAMRSVAAKFQKAEELLAARRASIPGGQVLLPGDRYFRAGDGWSVAEFDQGMNAFCWTSGDRQRVRWEGPEKPGKYQLTARFWRPYPFPESDLVIKYRLPDEKDWKVITCGTGTITIEGLINTSAPRQPLRMEFQIPSWIPLLKIAGSPDTRSIGVQLLSIELHPQEN